MRVMIAVRHTSFYALFALLAGTPHAAVGLQQETAPALLVAVQQGETRDVRRMLDRGTDPDSQLEDGTTALMLAAWLGRTEIAMLLVARGADVSATAETGVTALMAAAWNGHEDIAAALLEAGAAADARTDNDRTALMAAAERGHVDVVATLLEAGADPNAYTADGRTALTLAAEGGHDAVVDALRAGGAEETIYVTPEGAEGGPLPDVTVDDPPRQIACSPVPYPEAMRAAGIEGRVLLELVIDERGSVDPETVEVLEASHPAFEAPARQWAAGCRYRAARRGGQAVRVRVRLPVVFTVGGGQPR